VARARRVSTAAERRELWNRWKAGESVSDIARALDRADGTIHCTLREAGGVAPPERGRAARALQASEREEVSRGLAAGQSIRSIARRLARAPSMIGREIARNGGRTRWSPQQIAGWLTVQHPDDPEMRDSHETIYLTLLVQARGALQRELMSHLRRLRSVRRPKGALSNSRGQGQITDAVSIRQRPAEAEDRAIPGHWEGDLTAHP